MAALFDFLPIILFFIAFKLWGIYAATAVAIFATLIQATLVWYKDKKISPLLLISLAAVILLGSATIILKNEEFIKWKPTAVYLIFAAILWISEKVWSKNLIKSAIGEKIKFPESVWQRVNMAWVGLFLFMGGINGFVVLNFSTETWVNFKLFGLTGLLIVFVIAQSLAFSKYAGKDDDIMPLQNRE